jgi:UDP-2-acetamido-3-amino-2,3-dideoxy-glucuronate N-acetyltransferase
MQSKLQGVRLVVFPTVQAARGNLTALELPEVVPFHVRRIFLVHHVSNSEVRGEHAHKKCWQLLISTTGTVTVDLSDGEMNETFILESPERGLLIPPLIWGTQRNFSSNAALLVLASEAFDPDDYLHSFQEFKDFRRENFNRI